MRKVLTSLLILLFMVGALSKGVLAQSENELLPAGAVIDSDYIRSGQTVQIDGEVHGDAFLIGGLVTVNGKIDGDLFIFGGKVSVNGEVTNSIRIVGGDVTINGPVGRNVLVVCGNCTVSNQTAVEGSLLSVAGNLDLAAKKIGRGFRFFGRRLYLNSPIVNEAFIVADQEFLLGSQASISGDLKYTSSQEVIRQSGATVAGRIVYERANQDESYPKFFGAKTILEYYKRVKPLTDTLGFFISALLGFILLGLFPKSFEKIVRAIEISPYAAFGWGIIISLMIPVVVILFALTIVGIPISVVLVIIAYFAWTISQYLVAFFVGRRILKPKFGERRGWALLLGLGIISLLNFVPVLGRLVQAILTIFALGAIVLSYKQTPIFEQQALPQTPSVVRPRRKVR